MPSIQEKRQKILSAKLQEMGDIGVTKRSAEESPFFDQPVELEPQEAPIPTEETSEDAIPTISETENELHVAYTMDTVDEDEVLREELMFTPDPTPEVSPSAILARDLVRMGCWSKHDDALDKEDEAEVQATLGKVQGTDLIEKYKENLKAQESKHTKFLEAMRRAEEAQIQSDMVKTEHLPRQEPQGSNERTLDYYL